MPIQREDEFLVTRDLGITPSVGIESSRLLECIAHARSFDGAFGTPGFGFREDNLDFLATLIHLRQVWFTDFRFASIDGIYNLQGLEYCGVMGKRPGIDYSKFPRLRTVVAHWNPKDLGFEKATIRSLHLWRYKPHSKSFEGLLFPPDLEELDLNWVNPSSLAGMPPMPKLLELGIHRSRNMEDLSLLPIIAPNLKKLYVTASSKAMGLAGVEGHPSIEDVVIDGKRIVG
jgi:hypothetical protein